MEDRKWPIFGENIKLGKLEIRIGVYLIHSLTESRNRHARVQLIFTQTSVT